MFVDLSHASKGMTRANVCVRDQQGRAEKEIGTIRRKRGVQARRQAHS